jgi:hypothetical protein
LHDWRRAREEGGEAALARKRGRPPLDPGFKTQRKEIGIHSAPASPATAAAR